VLSEGRIVTSVIKICHYSFGFFTLKETCPFNNQPTIIPIPANININSERDIVRDQSKNFSSITAVFWKIKINTKQVIEMYPDFRTAPLGVIFLQLSRQLTA